MSRGQRGDNQKRYHGNKQSTNGYVYDSELRASMGHTFGPGLRCIKCHEVSWHQHQLEGQPCTGSAKATGYYRTDGEGFAVSRPVRAA